MKINLIWRDIITLPKWQYIFLLGASLFFIINSIIDYTDGWTILSLFASITSVLNVWLIANKRGSNPFWGIFSCIFYGVYAWQSGYVGDGILNIAFYLPLTIALFFAWRKRMLNHLPIIVVAKRRWKWSYLPIILVSTIIVFVAWLYLIPEISKLSIGGYPFKLYSWQHIFDSFTNGINHFFNYIQYDIFE